MPTNTKTFTVDARAVRTFMETIFGNNHMGPSSTKPEDVAVLSKQLVAYGLPKDIVETAAGWVNEDIKSVQSDPLAGLLASLGGAEGLGEDSDLGEVLDDDAGSRDY